jgi:hypothetical protein
MSFKAFRYFTASKHLIALHDFGILHQGSVLRVTFSGVSVSSACIGRTAPNLSAKVNSSPALATHDLPWTGSCELSLSIGNPSITAYTDSICSAGATTGTPSMQCILSPVNTGLGDSMRLLVFASSYRFFLADILADDFVDGVVASNQYAATGWVGFQCIVASGGTVTIQGVC